MTRRVLVLRPEPGNSRTIQRITARGLDGVACPLFEIAPLDWTPPDAADFDALLITSANAPRFAGNALKQFHNLPVHAVGKASADAARAAGFHIASVGASDAAALIAKLDGLKLLHLCGADVADTAGDASQVMRVVVYESRAIPLPAGFADALAMNPLALLHSPRAASRFAELVDASGVPKSNIAIAAISAKAASAAGPGWQRLAIAAEPRDDPLLDAAEALLRDLRDP